MSGGDDSAYASTKATLRPIVRTVAAELAGNKIRVNSIAAGPIETPNFDGGFAQV
ncbi:MAG: SDR family oxidoreductase [Nannocystaceae bacterium]|nr:SDR family oxidoreductase [Nannocystaceae bacterium]